MYNFTDIIFIKFNKYIILKMKQDKIIQLLIAFLLGVCVSMIVNKYSSKVEGMHCHCPENTTQSTCINSEEKCKWENGRCMADI